jgi:hypothetical protein
MIADAAIAGRGTGGQELQRDFTIESRVPGPVYLSERAAPDPLDEPKMTPDLRRVGNIRLQTRLRDLRGRRWTRRRIAMEFGNDSQYPQLFNEWPRDRFRVRFGSRPVEGDAVEDRVGEIVDPRVIRRHVSSPRPA